MYHIDRSYRDTYYMYFSNQHFMVKRYSRRISFFFGEYDAESYFAEDKEIEEKLNQTFIGACVINPLIVGAIGRTLINPEFFLNKDVRPVYVRLSDFKLNVYGRVLTVKAFPYRMQDQQTMCCAEVMLLNLLEYYSNSYEDYRAVVPSEIIENEQKHSYERVLPVRGITYPVLTKVLSEFGFSPRLYNISAIDSYTYSYVSQKLDAPNAYAIIRSLLHSEMFGIREWAGEFLKKEKDVVIRLFMASSRSYKAYRMHTMKDPFVKQLYTLIPMPRFIWVCELYRWGDYDDLLAFGEIVIDATSAASRGHRSLILMHYPKVIAYRHPDQAEDGFDDMAELEEDDLFSGYQKNLIPIKPIDLM